MRRWIVTASRAAFQRTADALIIGNASALPPPGSDTIACLEQKNVSSQPNWINGADCHCRPNSQPEHFGRHREKNLLLTPISIGIF
jgi:hypothetical protein